MSMDTIVLAAFVSHGLIGVYEVAWNLASLFAIFGVSITRTLFPEMSKINSERGDSNEISGLLRVSLAYTGLFIIPGLIGAALVGDVVLTIYGDGFAVGYYILLILIFARLLYGYMSQFLSTINALDRPDLTFYINAVFVVVNLGLNVLLTWQYGWYGAAAATTLSAGLGLVLGYYFATRVTTVEIPTDEIAKQVVAAAIMALVVFALRWLIGDSLSVIVVIVGVGAIVYFLTLLLISAEFRKTVVENLPFQLPIIDTA